VDGFLHVNVDFFRLVTYPVLCGMALSGLVLGDVEKDLSYYRRKSSRAESSLFKCACLYLKACVIRTMYKSWPAP